MGDFENINVPEQTSWLQRTLATFFKVSCTSKGAPCRPLTRPRAKFQSLPRLVLILRQVRRNGWVLGCSRTRFFVG